MDGFQFTFFTQQDHRHGHQRIEEWLIESSRSVGIPGVTVSTGTEGIGRSGRVHSAHFIELTDQPIEITMVATVEQGERLMALLEEQQANLFYVRTPVRFGVVGGPADREP